MNHCKYGNLFVYFSNEEKQNYLFVELKRKKDYWNLINCSYTFELSKLYVTMRESIQCEVQFELR